MSAEKSPVLLLLLLLLLLLRLLLLLLLLRDVCVGGAGQGGHFVMTGSVKSHLHNLARAALIGRYPILLQVTNCSTIVGPVSSAYVAALKIRVQLIVYK